MMMFQKNPEKLDAKAIDYERKGKLQKAVKCREKAQRMRGASMPTGSMVGGSMAAGRMPATTVTTTTMMPITTTQGGFSTYRTPQQYEQNALKWEKRGNLQKAQKNREKVWRLQNPSYGPDMIAPQFYENNQFRGYQVQGLQRGAQMGAVHHSVMAPVVETHVHATVIEQTTRPERIVEVQPVIHRSIDAPEVHVIEKHSYEQVRGTGPNVITKQAIVEETVRPRIIEEVQPVIHREVPAPFVERVEQHVTEYITQPTTMTKEVLTEGVRPPGMAAGAPLQTGMQQGMQQGGMQGMQGGMQQGGMQGMQGGMGGMQQGMQGMQGGQGMQGQGLQQGLQQGQTSLRK